MPGVNTSGKPSTENLYLGRGSIELAVINPTTYKPYDFRMIGNANAFSLNLETEKLEHQSSRSGVRTVDREIILQQKVGVSITMDEVMNFDNLAVFLSGQAEKGVANAAAAGNFSDVLQVSAAKKGRSFSLVTAAGARLFDARGTIVVKSGALGGGAGSATTLTAGTHYEIDRVWGTIFLLEAATHTDGHAIWASYTSLGTEAVVDQVTMLTVSKTSAFLRFKGINPANSDRKVLVELHSVSLSADGELGLIGEEFGEMSLTGVAERNEIGFPTAPTGRVYYHANAI